MGRGKMKVRGSKNKEWEDERKEGKKERRKEMGGKVGENRRRGRQE